MEKLFVDTGAWYAYINREDPDHLPVKRHLAKFKGKAITSNYVFAETITLVRYRLGHEMAVQVGKILREARDVKVVWLTPADEEQAWQLFTQRNDKRYSLTDCSSFALMRRLKIDYCLTTDKNFAQERFVSVI